MLSPACSIEASLLRGGALVGRRERVGDHLALDVLTSARRGDSSCDATLHTPLVGALAIGFPASTRLSVGRSFCSHSSLTKSIFFSSRSERRGCSGSAAAANFFCRLTSPSYRVRSFLDPTRSSGLCAGGPAAKTANSAAVSGFSTIVFCTLAGSVHRAKRCIHQLQARDKFSYSPDEIGAPCERQNQKGF